MKYINSLRNLVIASFIGITSVASAQTVHPISYGFNAAGARPNWYKDYVGIRFLVTTPSSIAGNKDYTNTNDGSGATGAWGGVATTMINQPVKYGVGADTIGCAAYPTGYFTGKIALVKRGNCEFGFKALQAQNAGAIAVVIFNNQDGGPVGMAAGSYGSGVTVPVYMISKTDGDAIAAVLNASGSVNLSIIMNWGIGLGSDLGFVPAGYSITANNAMPYSQLNAHGLPYKNKDGAFIANYGRNRQSNVKLKSTLSFTPTGGSASVTHTDSVTLASFPVADSIYAMYTTAYDVPTVSGAGKFDLTYNITSDSTDGFTGDNNFTYTFYATDSLYSKGRYDFAGDKPVTTIYTGPSTSSTDPYIWTVPYYIANGGSWAKEIQFSVVNGTGLLPTGDQLFMYLYKWTDNVYPDSLMENAELTLVGTGVKVFGATDSAFKTYTVAVTDTNGNPANISLDANSWYVVGAEMKIGYALGCDGVMSGYPRSFGRAHFDNYFEYYNPIWFGDRATSTNSASGAASDQYNNGNAPLYPWAFDGVGAYDVDSVVYDYQKGLIPGLAMRSTTHVGTAGVNGTTAMFNNLSVYPNPASDVVNVSVEMPSVAKQITYSVIDNAGRLMSRESHENVLKEVYSFNTNKLAAGNYYVVITVDGRSSTRKFVVAK